MRSLPGDRMVSMSSVSEELLASASRDVQELSGAVAQAERQAWRFARQAAGCGDAPEQPLPSQARPLSTGSTLRALSSQQRPLDPSTRPPAPPLSWEEVALPGFARTSTATTPVGTLNSTVLLQGTWGSTAQETSTISPLKIQSSESSAAVEECHRLRGRLEEWELRARQERLQWREERASLLHELQAARKSPMPAFVPRSTQFSTPRFRRPGEGAFPDDAADAEDFEAESMLGSEIAEDRATPELETLKHNLRAALEALAKLEAAGAPGEGLLTTIRSPFKAQQTPTFQELQTGLVSSSMRGELEKLKVLCRFQT
ncbi:unnamed protein product [Polarella glacialis]|uniref:Uncharacterized protein n=1 Tax=Polarella glacialis TaxID=89957 RepID=A0A813EQ29_POLGL|nr:unnamed protein product [Polarella glacialis]